MKRNQFFSPVFLVVLMSIFLVSTSDAEVEYDGSINTSGFVPGPNYIIDSSLGQQSGRNLFHSFKNFNIGQGENAKFVGSSEVSHIFARVTSGNSSVINGLVASDIDGASLWLINPNGIIFGQGAALDISGSFYATTSNRIVFDDGTFNSAPDNSVPLPGGIPQRIEILNNNPASIHANNPSLLEKKGNRIYFVASNVGLINTRLDADHIENIAIEYTGEYEVTQIQIGTTAQDVESALDVAIEVETNIQTVEKETVDKETLHKEEEQGGTPNFGREQIFSAVTPSIEQKMMGNTNDCRVESVVNAVSNSIDNNSMGAWRYPLGRYISYSTFQSENLNDDRCR